MRRCLAIPNRLMLNRASSALKLWPSSRNSSSSRSRRVGSESALNTSSITPMIGDHMVTYQGFSVVGCQVAAAFLEYLVAGAGKGPRPLHGLDRSGEQLRFVRVRVRPCCPGPSQPPQRCLAPGGRAGVVRCLLPALVWQRLRMVLLEERHHGFADQAAEVEQRCTVRRADQDADPDKASGGIGDL